MLNKKAHQFEFETVIKIVLLVSAFLIIVFFVFHLRNSASKSSEEAVCAASIQQHIAFTESYIRGKEKYKETVGPLSLFINPDLDIPEIKCDTKLIKSKAKNVEEAQKELTKYAIKTWKMFGEGKAMLYSNISEPFCIVTDVIQFKDNFFTAGKQLTDTSLFLNKINPYWEDISVKKYLSDFDTDNDNNILTPLLREDTPCYSSLRMIYLLGDYNLSFLSENKDFTGITEEYITYFFTKYVDADKAFKEIKKKYFDELVNINRGYYLEKNYALIFYQYHYSPPNSALISWISKNTNSYFLLSHLLIVPYNNEVMSQLKCGNLPVRFET